MDGDKVCFIIAHKYVRGYRSFLKFYIENIIKFYGDKALVLVVDNDSPHKDDIFDTIPPKKNIVFLDNQTECGFEIGGYKVGMKYILENNLIDNYHYYVCTQDTFIIRNKFDFNTLLKDKVAACPINSMFPSDGEGRPVVENVLTDLGLYNNMDRITFCWANSFIVSNKKLLQLYGFLSKITVTKKAESQASERYLARILAELNDYDHTDIDGDLRTQNQRHYDCHTVDPYSESKSFFVKTIQNKNQHHR